MTVSKFVFTAIDRIAVLLALAAGSAVFVLAGLITFDIASRRFFGLSVQGTDELGGYALAMVGSLGMAYVLSRREFTRIDLFYRYMPLVVQRILHVASYVALAGVVVFFSWHAWLTMSDTLLFQSRANTPLQTPLWIPQGLWTFGMAFFALSAVLQALRAVVMLVVAPHRIEREYGGIKIEDEVQQFMDSAASLDTGSPPEPGRHKD
jgi:TRAP-type C4-dicarboxylate transport system permease small subunit